MRRPKVPDQAHVVEKYRFGAADQIVSNTGYIGAVTLNAIDASHLAAYKALWTQYTINAVKFMFVPRYQGSEYNQAVQNANLTLSYAGQHSLVYISTRVNGIDGGGNAPASYVDALAATDSRIVNFPAGKQRYFYERRPKFLVDIRNASVADSEYQTGWLATADADDVNHYASCWWMESEGTGSQPFTCIVSLYVTFKDSRS